MSMPVQYYQALQLFSSGPQTSEDPPQVYYDLVDLGWIEPTGVNTTTDFGIVQCYDNQWSITPAGRMALSAYEDSMKKDARQEKQNRINNWFSAANVAISAVSFVLGILADHCFGIAEAVKLFFHF